MARRPTVWAYTSGKIGSSTRFSVLTASWLLSGSLGVRPVLYARSIGPLAHFFILRLAIANPGAAPNETRRKVLTHA